MATVRQRKDPVVAEQREIVRRVGLLFERADVIEREVAVRTVLRG